MLENYEEINLDGILDRAGLFRTEFETEEYDAILYDKEIKEILEELYSYDKSIIKLIKSSNDDEMNNNYLAVHRKFIETILRIKGKIKDDNYLKELKSNKTDYKVKRLLRNADIMYVLNKYLKEEPISEELLYIASFDYYLNFIIKLVLNTFEKDIPFEIKAIIKDRLEELNKYITKQ